MNKRVFAVTASASLVLGFLGGASLATHPSTQVEIGRPVISYDVTSPVRPLCRPFNPA